MSDSKFKAGEWVKQKTGTKGMTVVEDSGSGKVLCKFKDDEGNEVQEEFNGEDLVKL